MYKIALLGWTLLSALLVASQVPEMPPLVCPSDRKPTDHLGCRALIQKFPGSGMGVCCAYRDRCIRTCNYSKLACEYEYGACMLSVCRSTSIQFPELNQKDCINQWTTIYSGGFKKLNLTTAYDFSCEYMFELRKVSGCPNPDGTPKPVYLDTYQDPELDAFQRFWDIPL
ncbi:hypothetical protein K7432_005423 [Basidiobolus ranarum]|uniref:Uncharacterized protein n=1 Tax=Basidiobolus ranarum TaxID=34480 RepID=A0ABR2W339_9FUNG